MAEEEGKQFEISPEELWDRFQNDPIWAIRGRAIDEFARLEHFLCELMGAILDIPPDTAIAIFFNINAFRKRLEIMDDRLKDKTALYDKYGAFWKSLMNGVSRVNTVRNYVVHWQSSTWISQAGVEIRLFPGDYWTVTEGKPYLTVPKIVDFYNDCNYYARQCYFLKNVIAPDEAVDSIQLQAWQDKCQQPIPYPPQLNTQPTQTTEKPETQTLTSHE